MPIYALGDLEPSIDPTAYVHPDAVVIGAVTLASHASVWPGAVLRGDDAPITVGMRTSVQDGSIIHTTAAHPTRIGAECVIGHAVHMEGCVIRDRSLIGSGSIVLHGVEVGPDAIVGANAVVTECTVVPPMAMALGIPARVLADRVRPTSIAAGVASYVERAERFRRDLRRLA
ncbi:MAG TPA: gamma carbonic anhydrase family protein [Acidimicrobiales bacterium]|nr:gamma carbonic anhydrase family protein [Acidimicrobiales bacterium]